jgi:hypothetical protein
MGYSFYPEDAPLPDRLEGDGFIVRPLVIDDCAHDLDAMRSREGFADVTFEDNAADVRRHEREHVARLAFTYTVMSLDEARCLGCIYVLPVEGRHRTAVVSFWVRRDLRAAEFEGLLFAAIHSWFCDAFAFDTVLWRAHRSEPAAARARQRSLFGAIGLKPVITEDVIFG